MHYITVMELESWKTQYLPSNYSESSERQIYKQLRNSIMNAVQSCIYKISSLSAWWCWRRLLRGSDNRAALKERQAFSRPGEELSTKREEHEQKPEAGNFEKILLVGASSLLLQLMQMQSHWVGRKHFWRSHIVQD